MSAPHKRAKLQAGLLAAKGAPKSSDADPTEEASDQAVPAAAPAKKIKAEDIFYGKGDATAATFRPWYWSYERQGEEGAPESDAVPTASPGDAKAQQQRLARAAALLRGRQAPEPAPEPTGAITPPEVPPEPSTSASEAATEPTPEPLAEIAPAAEAVPPVEAATEPAPEPTAEIALPAEAVPPVEAATEPAPEPTAEIALPAEAAPPVEAATEPAPQPTAEIAAALEAAPPAEAVPEPAAEATAEIAPAAEAEIAPAAEATPPMEVSPVMDIEPSVESTLTPLEETASLPLAPESITDVAVADVSPREVAPTPNVAEDHKPLADPERGPAAEAPEPSPAVSTRPPEARPERPHERARRAMRAAQAEATAPPTKTKRKAAPAPAPVAEPEPPALPEPVAPPAAESAPSQDEIDALSAAPQPAENTAAPLPLSEDEPVGDLAATIESAMNRRRYTDHAPGTTGGAATRGGSLQNITGNSLLAELAAAREARGGEGAQRATQDSHYSATRTSRPLLDRIMTFGGVALIVAVAVLALSPAAQYGPVARLTHLFN